MTTWVPDLTQLPAANRQLIDPAAYNALNVPGMAAGTKFTHPGESTVVMKLTSPTFPTTSATGFSGPYSGIATGISRPWISGINGKTYYTHAISTNGGGVTYFVDVEYDVTKPYGQRNVGVGNARLAPVSAGDGTRLTFARNPATPTICYYLSTASPSTIIRYDFSTMVAAPTGNFGVSGTTFPEQPTGSLSLMNDDTDRYFMVMPTSYAEPQVWFDSQANTKKSFPKSRISSLTNVNGNPAQVKQGYLDRKTGLYAMMTFDAEIQTTRFTVFIWDIANDTWTVPIRKDNHTDWVDGYCISQDPNVGLGDNWRYLPVPVIGASPVADPGTMATVATGPVLTGGPQHHSGQWNQNGQGLNAYQLISEDNPVSSTLTARWVLDSGSVWKCTPTFAYGNQSIGVQQVIQLDPALLTVLQQNLTLAASRAAMVAGTWFYDAGTTTLYVWRTDGGAPTKTTAGTGTISCTGGVASFSNAQTFNNQQNTVQLITVAGTIYTLVGSGSPTGGIIQDAGGGAPTFGASAFTYGEQTVFGYIPSQAHFGNVYVNLAGTDIRRLCSHYTSGQTYAGQPHTTQSPDGGQAAFDTNMNRYNGPEVQRIVVEVPVTVIAGPAHHLALSVTSRAGLAGQLLAVQPVIGVQDSGNATVTTDTSSVTAALVVESGAAAATGTLTKAAASGLATFTDLGLASSSVIGSVCHWRYSRAGLPDLDGPSFTVLTSLAPSVR